MPLLMDLPDVLQGEDVGEEILVEDRILKIEEAYEGPAVDGDANIWARWSTCVTLDNVVVAGFRLRMPKFTLAGLGCCVVGLAAGENFDASQGGEEDEGKDGDGGFCGIRGGWSAQWTISNWKKGSYITCNLKDLPAAVYTMDGGGGVNVYVAFHRSRQEVLAAVGEHSTRTQVSEDRWPALQQELFPFIAIISEDFAGLEELEDNELPVLVEALCETSAREQTKSFRTIWSNP